MENRSIKEKLRRYEILLGDEIYQRPIKPLIDQEIINKEKIDKILKENLNDFTSLNLRHALDRFELLILRETFINK